MRPRIESVRNKQDRKLDVAEKSVKKTKKSGNGPRGGPFSDKEVRTILQSLHNKKTDKQATEDFLKIFPTSSRTAHAVKTKVIKVRAELVSSLTEFEKSEVSMMTYRFSLF